MSLKLPQIRRNLLMNRNENIQIYVWFKYAESRKNGK